MSVLGSLFGTDAKDAANAAAADQYAKEKKAIAGYTAYGDTLPGAYDTVAQGYQPWVGAGTDALTRLMGGLGLGGPGSGQEFTEAYRATPGYQAGLDAGTRAVGARFNANGMGRWGNAMKGIYRFGSDYEDQRAGDYLSRLFGLSGAGQQAAGAATGVRVAGLGARDAIRSSAFGGDIKSAGTIGQGMVAGAQSEQDAIGNLMKAAASVGGAYLGGRKT